MTINEIVILACNLVINLLLHLNGMSILKNFPENKILLDFLVTVKAAPHDWSTLDILFKSNCIILRHYLSIDAKQITASLFNIRIGANIVDPDQTAPTGAVWSGSTLFVCEASHFLVDE